ncbi:hypothetical protein [Actinomycetospora flava]|uniref:Antitoxin VbhA domain-containing protein n=1 Tax=Actinomycetospora flava TaxID=3129232 RepID=A0ABU8M2C2_9PSEU
MIALHPGERVAAAEALRRTVEAVESGEIEGDAFTRGYLAGVADAIDPPAPDDGDDQ